jgi:hypothetical protein
VWLEPGCKRLRAALESSGRHAVESSASSETERQMKTTTSKTGGGEDKDKDDQTPLPHERDQSSHAPEAPRDIMRQAASDLEQGLLDTDLHGERGVEKVKPVPPRQAKPLAPDNDGDAKPPPDP